MTAVISGFTQAVHRLKTSNTITFVLFQKLLGVVGSACLLPYQMFNFLIHQLNFNPMHLYIHMEQ